jgi:hypothetical protein
MLALADLGWGLHSTEQGSGLATYPLFAGIYTLLMYTIMLVGQSFARIPLDSHRGTEPLERYIG